MVSWFSIIITLVIFQRLVELWIARCNTRLAKAKGGYEVGREHYPVLVFLHGAFFASLLTETILAGKYHAPPVVLFLLVFLLAQLLRVWVLLSLGKMWNTRLIIVPNSKPVTSGPYRFLKHPNYLVVMIEFVTLPLSFGVWCTAFVFSILNFLVLQQRIKVEEAALKELPAFYDYFNSHKSRLKHE